MSTLQSPPRTARDIERGALNINPGGWSVQTDRAIATLLGSCVAVCLYDPKLRIGGMNHFLLPSRSSTRLQDEDIVLNGDYAMEVLVNALMAKGGQKQRLQAKAFGGGTIVSSIKMAIGQRNAEFAAQWLERERIPLTASDFGGPWSRKILLDPTTGDAFCRRQPTTLADVQAVVKAESEYETSLILPKKGGPSVELF